MSQPAPPTGYRKSNTNRNDKNCHNFPNSLIWPITTLFVKSSIVVVTSAVDVLCRNLVTFSKALFLTFSQSAQTAAAHGDFHWKVLVDCYYPHHLQISSNNDSCEAMIELCTSFETRGSRESRATQHANFVAAYGNAHVLSHIRFQWWCRWKGHCSGMDHQRYGRIRRQILFSELIDISASRINTSRVGKGQVHSPQSSSKPRRNLVQGFHLDVNEVEATNHITAAAATRDSTTPLHHAPYYNVMP